MVRAAGREDVWPVARGWRWFLAVAVALACFMLCWAGLAAGRVLDSGSQIGLAAVPLVVVLAVMGAWAERDEEPRAAGARRPAVGPARAARQVSESVAVMPVSRPGQPPAIWERVATVTQWVALVCGFVAVTTAVMSITALNGQGLQSEFSAARTLGVPSSEVVIVAGAAVIVFAALALRRRTRQLLVWGIFSMIVMIISGFQFCGYLSQTMPLDASATRTFGMYGLESDVLFDIVLMVFVVVFLLIVLFGSAGRSRNNG